MQTKNCIKTMSVFNLKYNFMKYNIILFMIAFSSCVRDKRTYAITITVTTKTITV